ncbi:MAG: CotH kinase family protein [Myxococcota bacterium]
MLLVALLACNGRGTVEVEPPPVVVEPPEVVEEEDDGHNVGFDIDELIEVRVTMDPADFEVLRGQARNVFDILGGDCTDRDFGEPFTWFEADVEIDDQAAERVGIRKKGFLGSLSEERPSLKIKTDKFVEGQQFGGTERITLNNQLQDPAVVRACLAYDVFEAAGVPAPRCNFARVEVNGEDLGVYAHIEDVKNDFLEDAFGGSEGHLYEGTLSDFRAGFTGTFEAKNEQTDPTGAPLQPLVDALTVPDAELEAALEPVLDVDAFLAFWAAEILVAHRDGYAMNTNNFFVFVGPDGRARFIPWGADQTLLQGDGAVSDFALTGELARRMYGIPALRQRFVAELTRQRDEAFDVDGLLARVERMERTIAPAVLEPLEVAAALDEVRAFIEARPDGITALIDALPDDVPPPSEPLCLEIIGTVSWAFTTAFDPALEQVTLDDTVTVTLDGATTTWSDTFSAAGYAEEGDAVITTLGTPSPDLFAQIVVGVPPDRFEPGTVPIDFVSAEGYLVIVDAVTEAPVFQGLIVGDLVLDAAGVGAGDPVSGSLQADVYAFP